MSQNLMDELFTQINRLERENERLQATIERFDREKEMVCKYTQFGDWREFMQWVTGQYESAFEIDCSDRQIWTPEARVPTMHQLVSTPPRLSDSMKTS